MSGRRYAESKWKPEVRTIIDGAIEEFGLTERNAATRYAEAYDHVKKNLPKGSHVSRTSFLLYAEQRKDDETEHPHKIYKHNSPPAESPRESSTHNGLHQKVLRLGKVDLTLHRKA